MHEGLNCVFVLEELERDGDMRGGGGEMMRVLSRSMDFCDLLA